MRSGTVTVVFRVDPETEEFERDTVVVDIHGGNPGAPKIGHLSDAEWTEDHFATSWPDPLETLFGDEIPAEVLRGGKFLARGHLESRKCGNPLDGYEVDQDFYVHAWRRL